MSLDRFVIRLERCNRCGWNGLEKLKTHMFCTNCNYSDELSAGETHDAIPEWAVKALKPSESEEAYQ